MIRLALVLLLLVACGGTQTTVRGSFEAKLDEYGEVTVHGEGVLEVGPLSVQIDEKSVGLCTAWPLPFCWKFPLEGTS